MANWYVHAAYDLEGQIWYTVDSDIPGLVTSGETIERLRERIHLIMPDLLELNAEHIADKERLKGPHQVRILHIHEDTQAVAA